MDSINPAALSLHPHYGCQQQHHVEPSPSPTPSSSSLVPPITVGNSVAMADSNLPPKPDRSKHDAIKARYKVLQSKWHDLVADRTKLAADLEAAELKREKLQAEADMLIEQMHELAPDISLAPDYVDLSSDGEENSMHDGYMHVRASSSSSHLGLSRMGQQYSRRRRSSIINDNSVPSSSINYFSGHLFGPNSGLDFDNDLGGGNDGSTPSGSVYSKRSSNNGEQGLGKDDVTRLETGAAVTTVISDQNEERQIMLSPEQAKEEEARIEKEQKARQRSRSYNPDNIKVRIGVMPSTFVHPLVRNNSNRSSKSRSPSAASDNASPPTPANEEAADDSNRMSNNERPAKRPRTMSKEKSPMKEQGMIKEEDEPNPP